MQLPPQNKIPSWVTGFCCIAPYLLLFAFAIACIVGKSISSPSLLGLVYLCSKTTSLVLTPEAKPNV